MNAVIHQISPSGLHAINRAIAERCKHVDVSPAELRCVRRAAVGASDGGYRVGRALAVAYKLLRPARRVRDAGDAA